MENYTEIDIVKWSRKEQYDFFRTFDDPFFNITARVEVGKLVHFCKMNHLSFNLACLFLSQKVINGIPEFRMRTDGDRVLLFDRVNCGSTVLMDDNTFRYCYFRYSDDVFEFDREGKRQIELLKKDPDFSPRDNEPDNIHYSTIPWISFSSVKHARRFGTGDSIPKLVFGKWTEEGGKIFLPVSVEAHHALVDGYHAGLYFSGLQDEINTLPA